MGDFTPSWLSLREPADALARSLALADRVGRTLRTDREVRAVDLGGGTGANVRYLAGHLPGRQDWLVVDRDPGLLAALPDRMARWASERGYRGYQVAGADSVCVIEGPGLDCRVRPRAADLTTAIGEVLGRAVDLVTASALLDLVSDEWLEQLVQRCRAVGAAVLFALTYDGRVTCVPSDPDDDTVLGLVNAHQRTDKGFGAALGPDAASTAGHRFAVHGYEVMFATSDWRVSTVQPLLQQQLIEGWAEAAAAMAPARADLIRGWRHRRLGHVAAGRSAMVVGHQDLAAVPA